MTFALVYLGLGILVGVVVRTLKGSHNRSDDAKFDFLATLGRRQVSVGRWLQERILIPVLAITVFLTAWPVLLPWFLYQDYVEKKNNLARRAPDQSVDASHLSDGLSYQDVEDRELVIDPLGGAPEVPFGHLNVLWLALLEKRQDGDQIHPFTARWRNDWGREDIVLGYALVRRGIVVEKMVIETYLVRSE